MLAVQTEERQAADCFATCRHGPGAYRQRHAPRSTTASLFDSEPISKLGITVAEQLFFSSLYFYFCSLLTMSLKKKEGKLDSEKLWVANSEIMSRQWWLEEQLESRHEKATFWPETFMALSSKGSKLIPVSDLCTTCTPVQQGRICTPLQPKQIKMFISTCIFQWIEVDAPTVTGA